MTLDHALGLVFALAVMVYLLAALLFPNAWGDVTSASR